MRARWLAGRECVCVQKTEPPQQLRTIARRSYDSDTGQPVQTQAETQQPDALWIAYPHSSEGHALLSGLCQLGLRSQASGSAKPSDA
jgi:hypothetical protein